MYILYIPRSDIMVTSDIQYAILSSHGTGMGLNQRLRCSRVEF